MRVLLIAQVVYWAFSYLVRPLILLMVNPAPAINDSVADPRLAYYGYAQALPGVLAPVAFGLFVYSITVGIIVAILRRKSDDLIPENVDLQAPATFVIAYVLGWLVRMLPMTEGNSLLSTLSYMAPIGAVGLIVYGRRQAGGSFMILGVLSLELIWSVMSASKTPILAVVIAIAIRFGIIGWSRRRAISIAILGVAAAGGFSVFQSFKLGNGVKQDLAGADAAYPVWISPFMSIVRRFDLLSAMTDAVYLGPGNWMTPWEGVQTALKGLVPRQFLLDEKVSAGSLWALEVRPVSTGVINPDVSLADGFIAEGYALNGFLGIALGAFFIAFLLFLVRKLLLSGSMFSRSLGILLIAYPALYERGVFGGLEIFGKSLQAAAVVWLIHILLVAALSRSRGNSRSGVS